MSPPLSVFRVFFLSVRGIFSHLTCSNLCLPLQQLCVNIHMSGTRSLLKCKNKLPSLNSTQNILMNVFSKKMKKLMHIWKDSLRLHSKQLINIIQLIDISEETLSYCQSLEMLFSSVQYKEPWDVVHHSTNCFVMLNFLLFTLVLFSFKDSTRLVLQHHEPSVLQKHGSMSRCLPVIPSTDRHKHAGVCGGSVALCTDTSLLLTGALV